MSDDYRFVNCPVCKGTKIHQNADGIISECLACRGNGRVFVTPNEIVTMCESTYKAMKKLYS